MKKIKTLLGSLLVLFVGLVAAEMSKQFFQSKFGTSKSGNPKKSIEQMLKEVTLLLNKDLPKKIDSETELVTTLPGPGRRLTYFYNLANYSSKDLTNDDLTKALAPRIKPEACKSMKSLLDNDVDVIYRYQGNDSQLIGQIGVQKSDCQ